MGSLFRAAQVRVEYLQQPDLYIGDVLTRVKPEYVQARYNLPTPLTSADGEEEADSSDTAAAATSSWVSDPELFLELVSRRTGKLLKVGCPRDEVVREMIIWWSL